MSVFYDTTKVSLIDWGTYWLSETPDVPSFGWDAKCRRTATWSLLEQIGSGKRFFFVNTHLDHVGVEARRLGLLTVVDRISQMNPDGYPMILCGDFNMYPQDASLDDLRAIMNDARETAEKTDREVTYHGYGDVLHDYPIDFIFWKGFDKCTEFARVTQPYLDCPYVSDHYPITAEFIFL